MKNEAEFMHKDLPVYAFTSEQDFNKWLSENYQCKEGFWLHFYKKSTGISTIQIGEAVNVAGSQKVAKSHLALQICYV